MSRKYRTISVDEQGSSCIVAVNGDEEAIIGSFGDGLVKYDVVVLDDDTMWTVGKIYTHIQTAGCGAANYVCVDLFRDPLLG